MLLLLHNMQKLLTIETDNSKEPKRNHPYAYCWATESPPNTNMLAATIVVFRCSTALSELSHVACLVDAFADSSCSLWTMESVTARGPYNESSVRQLDKPLKREWIGLDPKVRRVRFCQAVRCANLHSRLTSWIGG